MRMQGSGRRVRLQVALVTVVVATVGLVSAGSAAAAPRDTIINAGKQMRMHIRL